MEGEVMKDEVMKDEVSVRTLEAVMCVLPYVSFKAETNYYLLYTISKEDFFQ